MTGSVLRWFDFGGHADAGSHDHHHGHDHKDDGHGHTHGVIDPGIAATDEGIRAVKKSFVILAITAMLQLVVVYFSGSVALLADTIHNIGDAATAVPLWVAFALARRKPSESFNYGLGRVEDLAGVVIVLIIFASAAVAFYEAVDHLIHPRPVEHLAWLAAAGVVGFLGNEVVALFRISVGRKINSAALVADGYHARTDGLTSLAVVIGAAGVWLGFPLADPIIGLLITLAILGIVWQSARAVFRRLLDGIEPEILRDIDHASAHVEGIDRVVSRRARWVGHRLHIDLTIAIDDQGGLGAATAIAGTLKRELSEHLPALDEVQVQFEGSAAAIQPVRAKD